jgi:hypothetical protein
MKKKSDKELIYLLALLGATNREIDECIGYSILLQKPEFLETINRGRIAADKRVSDKIVRRILKNDTQHYEKEKTFKDNQKM